jgi:hypothetical protein
VLSDVGNTHGVLVVRHQAGTYLRDRGRRGRRVELDRQPQRFVHSIGGLNR